MRREWWITLIICHHKGKPTTAYSVSTLTATCKTATSEKTVYLLKGDYNNMNDVSWDEWFI